MQRTIYRIADERLGASEWAVGSYSIADIHLFRLYWRFFNSLKPEPGRSRISTPTTHA